MIWYSLSVRVWAGATVIESPVWTPIGSKFSIEQTMTQLSARSAHHLHLVFLPAEERFLDQDLADGREVEAALHDLLEFLPVVADAAAGAAHGEGGADDEREGADPGGHLAGLVEGVGGAGEGHVEADLLHRLLEELAVLALLDRVGVGADHLHAVAGERARFVERHGGVERGLAAEGGQEGVGLFALDDLFHDLGG